MRVAYFPGWLSVGFWCTWCCCFYCYCSCRCPKPDASEWSPPSPTCWWAVFPSFPSMSCLIRPVHDHAKSSDRGVGFMLNELIPQWLIISIYKMLLIPSLMVGFCHFILIESQKLLVIAFCFNLFRVSLVGLKQNQVKYIDMCPALCVQYQNRKWQVDWVILNKLTTQGGLSVPHQEEFVCLEFMIGLLSIYEPSPLRRFRVWEQAKATNLGLPRSKQIWNGE